jgi:hypothetical protein
VSVAGFAVRSGCSGMGAVYGRGRALESPGSGLGDVCRLPAVRQEPRLAAVPTRQALAAADEAVQWVGHSPTNPLGGFLLSASVTCDEANRGELTSLRALGLPRWNDVGSTAAR